MRFALPQNSNVELLITTSRGGYPITTLVPERYYEAKRKGLSSSASKRYTQAQAAGSKVHGPRCTTNKVRPTLDQLSAHLVCPRGTVQGGTVQGAPRAKRACTRADHDNLHAVPDVRVVLRLDERRQRLARKEQRGACARFLASAAELMQTLSIQPPYNIKDGV